jgi:hypothetical protein
VQQRAFRQLQILNPLETFINLSLEAQLFFEGTPALPGAPQVHKAASQQQNIQTFAL